jgi:hypothetical protein
MWDTVSSLKITTCESWIDVPSSGMINMIGSVVKQQTAVVDSTIAFAR